MSKKRALSEFTANADAPTAKKRALSDALVDAIVEKVNQNKKHAYVGVRHCAASFACPTNVDSIAILRCPCRCSLLATVQAHCKRLLQTVVPPQTGAFGSPAEVTMRSGAPNRLLNVFCIFFLCRFCWSVARL